MIRSTRRRTAALVVGSLLLLPGLAACSSDDKEATTDTTLPPAEQWAVAACTAITTWRTSVAGIATAIQFPADTTPGSAAGEQATGRYDQLKAANRQLLDDLKAAGLPETNDGQQIRAEADKLSTQLDTSTSQLEASITAIGDATSVVQMTGAMASAATAINQVANDVSATAAAIRQLDPASELGAAVAKTEACQAIRSGNAEGPATTQAGS
jgi:hypothetical protein